MSFDAIAGWCAEGDASRADDGELSALRCTLVAPAADHHAAWQSLPKGSHSENNQESGHVLLAAHAVTVTHCALHLHNASDSMPVIIPCRT